MLVFRQYLFLKRQHTQLLVLASTYKELESHNVQPTTWENWENWEPITFLGSIREQKLQSKSPSQNLERGKFRDKAKICYVSLDSAKLEQNHWCYKLVGTLRWEFSWISEGWLWASVKDIHWGYNFRETPTHLWPWSSGTQQGSDGLHLRMCLCAFARGRGMMGIVKYMQRLLHNEAYSPGERQGQSFVSFSFSVSKGREP